tara:strand:- start:290 stop:451 length:162 start_codon:yes stop_codon:yes gene_type:complete
MPKELVTSWEKGLQKQMMLFKGRNMPDKEVVLLTSLFNIMDPIKENCPSAMMK